MKHLVKQHRAQCMLYAFAMAMDTDPLTLIKLIGHDGTEVLWPELPIPRCYRGFHPCEFMYAGFKSWPPVSIYEFPRQILLGHSDSTIKEVLTKFKLETDVLLYSGNGVFLTDNHAYAWDGLRLYDPDKLPTTCGDISMYYNSVNWHTYYAVRKERI